MGSRRSISHCTTTKTTARPPRVRGTLKMVLTVNAPPDHSASGEMTPAPPARSPKGTTVVGAAKCDGRTWSSTRLVVRCPSAPRPCSFLDGPLVDGPLVDGAARAGALGVLVPARPPRPPPCSASPNDFPVPSAPDGVLGRAPAAGPTTVPSPLRTALSGRGPTNAGLVGEGALVSGTVTPGTVVAA